MLEVVSIYQKSRVAIKSAKIIECQSSWVMETTTKTTSHRRQPLSYHRIRWTRLTRSISWPFRWKKKRWNGRITITITASSNLLQSKRKRNEINSIFVIFSFFCSYCSVPNRRSFRHFLNPPSSHFQTFPKTSSSASFFVKRADEYDADVRLKLLACVKLNNTRHFFFWWLRRGIVECENGNEKNGDFETIMRRRQENNKNPHKIFLIIVHRPRRSMQWP